MPSPFTREELAVLRGLTTPAKIQDFLNAMPFNFEADGDTCRSPRRVLRDRTANCMEGAMFAAAALRLQGRKPLILDLEAHHDDCDHVVALFQGPDGWGAISKTNHSVLRYREPIYRSVRELAMTYFHEYYYGDGRKTLRAFSKPIDLSRFDKRDWMTAEDDVWFVPEHLCDVPHTQILTPRAMRGLRRTDEVENRIVFVYDWEPPQKVAEAHKDSVKTKDGL